MCACVCVRSSGLTLVSAPHLARSFHHLFPLEAFQERPLEERTGDGCVFMFTCSSLVLPNTRYTQSNTLSSSRRFCQACQAELKDKSVSFMSLCARGSFIFCTCHFSHTVNVSLQVFTCPVCASVFCVECDVFIHDTLHCCPCCIQRQGAS